MNAAAENECQRGFRYHSRIVVCDNRDIPGHSVSHRLPTFLADSYRLYIVQYPASIPALNDRHIMQCSRSASMCPPSFQAKCT